jgi:D-alanine transaminase
MNHHDSRQPVLPERRVPAAGRGQGQVLDRGFIFGDGIYDVVPVYGRRLFRFDEHMARLDRSLDKIRIANPATPRAVAERCRRWSRRWPSHRRRDQVVYIQVTRGVAPRDHVMPAGRHAHGLHDEQPDEAAHAEQRHQGVACVTARDFRWERGDIKSTSLLGNVLARQISADHGALETIMFRDGFLTEASASNVWIVHEGALLGPPKSEHVLEGIRVELLRELCEDCGIAYNLRPISEADVLAADEVLLSSATKEILPVTRIDGEEPSATARCAASPGRCTRGCTRPTSAPSRRCRSEPPCAMMPTSRPTEPDRVPQRLPDQGDGRAGRRLRGGHRRRGAHFDPASTPPASSAPQQGRQLPGPDDHRHRHQPRAARRAVPHAEHAPDGPRRHRGRALAGRARPGVHAGPGRARGPSMCWPPATSRSCDRPRRPGHLPRARPGGGLPAGGPAAPGHLRQGVRLPAGSRPCCAQVLAALGVTGHRVRYDPTTPSRSRRPRPRASRSRWCPPRC